MCQFPANACSYAQFNTSQQKKTKHGKSVFMNFSCLSLKSQTRTSACQWQRPLPAPCCKATQQISPSVNLSLHRGADVWEDLSERSRACPPHTQTHVCNQLQEIEDWHLIWITGEDRRKPAMVPYLRCFDLKTYKGVKITELKKPWRQAEPFICSIRTLQRALLLRFIGCLFLQGRWSDCNPVHSIHHPLSDSFSPLQ